MDGYNLDDSIIEYIAKNIKSNIRELEGSLNKIIAYANLEKREVTMELAETVLIRRSSLQNISSILWPNIMTSHRRILLVQKETVKSSILGRLPCIFAVNWPIFR